MVTTAVAPSQEVDNESVINEMLQRAPEPGDIMGEGRIINRGDEEEQPFPTVASNLVSPGHVLVYHTETGESSVVRRDLLSLHLSKMLPSGKPAFTTKPPAIPPVRGVLKCLLHPQHPNRSQYARFGMPPCPKDNLMTEWDVEQHMKARHKREWASMESDRLRRELEEDRGIQRAMMKSLTGKAGKKQEAKVK